MLKTAGDLIREAQQHIECVDAQTAKQMYDDNPGAVILDVREADSAAESKLKDSINISRGLGFAFMRHAGCANQTYTG